MATLYRPARSLTLRRASDSRVIRVRLSFVFEARIALPPDQFEGGRIVLPRRRPRIDDRDIRKRRRTDGAARLDDAMPGAGRSGVDDSDPIECRIAQDVLIDRGELDAVGRAVNDFDVFKAHSAEVDEVRDRADGSVVTTRANQFDAA